MRIGGVTMEAVGLVVVVALLCLFHIVYVIFESEQGLSAKIGPGVSNKVLMRQRRQTPGEDYTYTLEILIVVDPAVFSWFISQSRPGTERDMTEEATNKTLRHYRRVFRGIKTRFVTSTVLSLNLVLVDIIIPENLSFPSPIPFMPSPRTLITAPEVLDTFRSWVNKTELPNHDHALLFTGTKILNEFETATSESDRPVHALLFC
uniref:Uncharacterized protein LOC111108541 n=1 Tax=Crassostrea virginica TaxID=6565 RepID=A0A8B8BBT6_CRAVI|nr:uncharacterized protein LOC111108541 [Crassostrea virginica]